MPTRYALFFRIVIVLVIGLASGGCDNSSDSYSTTSSTGCNPQDPGAGPITPRMLVAPNALVGPGPSDYKWSPVGAKFTYIDASDDHDVLWLYDPESAAKRVILDPTGNPDNIDLSSAQWSPQGNRILLTGKTSLWLLDVKTNHIKSLAAGSSPKTGLMFLPAGTHISYVQNNDIYLASIDDGLIQRLTNDGTKDIFNGSLDWVYNEELATRAAQPAYAWSPDGTRLVYLQLDDTRVQNHPITDYNTVPPSIQYTRYPVAGTENPKVSLHLVSPLAGIQKQTIPLSSDVEYVLPLFTWTPDGEEALFLTVNRDHTLLSLQGWNPVSGSLRTIISETSPDWINEDRYALPIFVGNGQQFLWLSERDGFMHLYLYTRQGTLIQQLTSGDWMIDSSAWNLLTPGKPVHTDPEGTYAYFITTGVSPLERRIIALDISTGAMEQMSPQPGFHTFSLSGDGRYLLDKFSDVTTPPATMIVKTDQSGAQLLAQQAGPSLNLPAITREFITLKAYDGTDLYAQLVKPENFDPQRKYPVVIHWYGGPGLQMVANRYGTTNIFNIIERDVLYTQQGYLVWRLDNRGAFGRGHEFESPIMGELGPDALDDQLAGLDYLSDLPYVDPTRVGVDGKSFGGYLTLYALINAPDRFRCGVAVAGPTNWAYYDTIYTERYMRTPTQNPAGYAATNLIASAAKIKARPLLVHGLADTNVHIENTVNFIAALEEADKPFNYVELPNTGHSIKGDSLVATLSASLDYFKVSFCSSQ